MSLDALLQRLSFSERDAIADAVERGREAIQGRRKEGYDYPRDSRATVKFIEKLVDELRHPA